MHIITGLRLRHVNGERVEEELFTLQNSILLVLFVGSLWYRFEEGEG